MRSNAEARKRSESLDFMAMRQVGRYHARRLVRFSTLKSLPSSLTPKIPSIHPRRDALLAGLCVAAAISLGAYLVYARACNEKVADTHRHIAQLCKTLSEPAARLCCKLAPNPDAISKGNALILSARDNCDEARRIYAFSLEDDSRALLDTGRRHETAGTGILPDEARIARDRFRKRSRASGGCILGSPWRGGDHGFCRRA